MSKDPFDDVEAAQELLNEELEKLRRSLYESNKKEEEALEKDEVNVRFLTDPIVESSPPTISNLKDLGDIFTNNIPCKVYPLNENEGASDFGKVVKVRSIRQLAIFNSIYDKVLCSGERVLSVPTLSSRIIHELIKSTTLIQDMKISLNEQWHTGLNHLLNRLFSLGHPPEKEAILTRYKFEGKAILWYRFTDRFLIELYKQKGIIGYRRTLRKFGVEVDPEFLDLRLGLGIVGKASPTHWLLRVTD